MNVLVWRDLRSVVVLVATLLFCAPLGCWLALVAEASGGERDGDLVWPQFLGPGRDGVPQETGLNLDWDSAPPKVLWKVPVGRGFSSMSVVGNRLFTTAERGERDAKRDFVVCYDTGDGREIWACDAVPACNIQSIVGPRATPTFHDGKLYCLMTKGDLYCLNASDGGVVWKTNIFTTTGATEIPLMKGYYWGMAASPLVEGDLVIVQPGGPKDNAVAAYDRRNGRLVWRVGSARTPGYGSPMAITAAGRRQVICTMGRSLLGVEPSDGKLLWRFPWGNSVNAACATPIWVDNLLFVSADYGTGAAALEIVAADDGVQVRERWRNRDMQNHFSTSMVLGGYVYGCHGRTGVVRCLDLATGDVRWTERKPGKCSLIAAQGHLICLNEKGTLYLVEANPEQFTLKGTLEGVLGDFRVWAPPALAHGRLYARDLKDLICIDLRR